jgi:lipid A 3-O-deacylase
MIRKTALATALAFAIPAQAVDSVSFEIGRGSERTDLWRAGLQSKWDKRWFAERSWTLGAYWDFQFGRWLGPQAGGERGPGDDEVLDISVTPVFRLERARRATLAPYVEAAIGFHLLSNQRINFRRFFSTQFQYGDHIGVGARFGERYRYDLSLRLQHLSNGGLSEPNPGINFLQVRFQYHFDP